MRHMEPVCCIYCSSIVFDVYEKCRNSLPNKFQLILMFMRHKKSLPDKFHHIWCLWDTQNLSSLYVPSYLMFMRHTESLFPVISILIDVHGTWNISTLFVPSYLMLHAAHSSASLASASEPTWRECESIQDLWIRTDRKLRAVQKKLKLSLARVHSALQSHSVGTSKELSTTFGSSWAGPPYAT